MNQEAQVELKEGWQRAVKIVRTELDDCEVRHATAEARVRDLEQERREMERQVAELKRAVEHEKLEAGMAANVAATDVSAMALRLKTAEDALTDAQEARLAVVKQATALETTVADMEAKRAESETAHEKLIQRIEQAHVDQVEALVAEHDHAKVRPK